MTVFDVDGVLADVRHRLGFLEQRPKDWLGFFTAADSDTPLAEGFALLAERAALGPVVYLTGRPERIRKVTETWLSANGAADGRLVMRRGRDFRPAAEFKLERLALLGGPARVALLVDDDASVCRAAKAAGYAVQHARWVPRSPTLFDAQEHQGRT